MKKTILIAAVLFFAFSVAASAQITALFDVGSTPVTTDASCGKTEKVGQIVFSTVSGSSPVITGTISINYQVPVTSTVGATITVTAAGVVQPAGTTTLLTAPNASTLLFQINPGAGLALPVNIIVDGVKVDVSSSPNLANLTATVTGTNESFVAGETSVVVVSSISSALNTDVTVVTSAPANISSVNPAAITTQPTVTVKEGFLGAWLLGSAIQFNFSALPAGTTLTFPTTIAYGSGASGVFTLLPSLDTTSTATPKTLYKSTDGAFSVVYRLTTLATVPATPVQSTLTLAPTLALPGPAPLGLGSVTVSAQMAALTPATVLPQYVSGGCATKSVTIFTVVPASTTLLMPYATVGGLYDTGIAIANTSSDPAAIVSNAVKQDGAITFYFFSQDGTNFQFPAAGATLATGKGLTSGVLKSGGLYTVLLSELLTAAAKGPAFSGYIFAVVNATSVHGQYFISDFKAFTNGALMLVVDPSARNATVEKLDN